MYLVPPMPDDPPPEFVAFVITRLDGLRRDAARLTGGDPDGTHLYMDALADVAGHWRGLTLLGRLRRTLALSPADTAGDYLARRLATRTRSWRDDQIFDVDIRVLDDRPAYGYYARPSSGSLALRKATLLPGTIRSAAAPLADAAIAWVQAYRRAFYLRILRTFALTLATIAILIWWVTWLTGGTQ